MSKQVTLVDNRDGSPADVTTSMTFEGVKYTWDLSSDNHLKLHRALKPWLDCAETRKVGAAASSNGSGSADKDVMRAWARENGFDVSDRGRIPVKIVEAFEEAHA